MTCFFLSPDVHMHILLIILASTTFCTLHSIFSYVWDIMKAFLSASGECLSGALWWEDLVRLAEEVGFCKPRLVTASFISVGNEELEKLLGKGLIVVNLCFQSKLLWLPFQCNYQLLFRTTFLEVHFFLQHHQCICFEFRWLQVCLCYVPSLQVTKEFWEGALSCHVWWKHYGLREGIWVWCAV